MEPKNFQRLIKQALKEDIGPEPEGSRSGAGKKDITTETIIVGDVKVKAVIISKNEGVIAGLDIAKTAFQLVAKNIKFRKLVKDGDNVHKNQILAILYGEAKNILTAERTALNFLGHLSGIATLTSKYAEKTKPYKCKILDTRKTTPLLREMEKYAVKTGGGHNHRMGLYDMVLIKDNHIKLISHCEIKKLIKSVRRKISSGSTTRRLASLRSGGRRPKNTKIEIEVETLDELKNAYDCKADIIMLDNMNPAKIKKAVRWIKQQKKFKAPLLEASGNINFSNVKEIAKTGIDFISIGEITHSAPALDMSLKIIEVNEG